MKELYCNKCKMKTEHIESGFEGYNRRHRCLVCKNEDYFSGEKWEMIA